MHLIFNCDLRFENKSKTSMPLTLGLAQSRKRLKSDRAGIVPVERHFTLWEAGDLILESAIFSIMVM